MKVKKTAVMFAFVKKYGKDATPVIINKFLSKYKIDAVEFLLYTTRELGESLATGRHKSQKHESSQQAPSRHRHFEKQESANPRVHASELMSSLQESLPQLSGAAIEDIVERTAERIDENAQEETAVNTDSKMLIDGMAKHWAKVYANSGS